MSINYFLFDKYNKKDRYLILDWYSVEYLVAINQDKIKLFVRYNLIIKRDEFQLKATKNQ
ncbi:hypothetical protein [Mycoplasmopsis cynos]|uniref:Uncharacterized protein n=1 Tax=Mycoplasmopsis cynos (strain C142) TaxID=1246955 RepID=L0RUZ9_MYCC1|nr:hypothetical protein [Mycoplasmopsis cynos]CCP24473.1 Hypothetical protein MCYN_0741 [Mycoplasmopsis cynos C142]